MRVLVLGYPEVRRLLPMAECIDVMAQALAARSRGEAVMPLRQILWLPDRTGALAWMPAFLPGMGALGAKAITAFNANTATPYESHQGPVLLFEPEHGRLLAVVDASTITAVRTAAVSGVATRALARPEAGVLAVLGNGVQAALHVEAMRAVRPVREVRVWGRNPERALAFARRTAERTGLAVRAAASAAEAVAGADIVCTTTAATDPILHGGDLSPGCHVNAVGAGVPGYRELDAAAVAACRVYVDARESAAHESDELRAALEEGAIGSDHVVGELGELLLDRVEGRRSAEERTLFKSMGLAVEDLAAARYVYDRAVATGTGTWVEFSPEREA